MWPRDFFLTVTIVSLAGTMLATTVGHASAVSAKRGAPRLAGTVYDFRVTTIDGDEVSLDDYRGKALLIVNTASRCGFTSQYKSLEALYQRYRQKGFEVLAFPSNDFMRQEPGTNAEIKEFCSLEFRTTFPLFAKISVKGKRISPLYAFLTRESNNPGEIGWNFTKFLVAPDGRVVARFDPAVDPLSKRVTDRLDALLGGK